MQLQKFNPPAAKNAPTEKDAIEIWIARWLHHKRSAIVARYKCDPRRIYEIWEGKRFPKSRDLALKSFIKRYPQLRNRVDFSPHKRIPRSAKHPDQLSLFDKNATS